MGGGVRLARLLQHQAAIGADINIGVGDKFDGSDLLALIKLWRAGVNRGGRLGIEHQRAEQYYPSDQQFHTHTAEPPPSKQGRPAELQNRRVDRQHNSCLPIPLCDWNGLLYKKMSGTQPIGVSFLVFSFLALKFLAPVHVPNYSLTARVNLCSDTKSSQAHAFRNSPWRMAAC